MHPRQPTKGSVITERLIGKSLLALRDVGPESEAESVRFHGRRVTKVGPEVKHGLFRVAGRVRNPNPLRRRASTEALAKAEGSRSQLELLFRS